MARGQRVRCQRVRAQRVRGHRVRAQRVRGPLSFTSRMSNTQIDTL